MKALEIKNKIEYGLATAYIISGDDSILKNYVLKSICDTLPADERDYSITTFEGNKAEVVEIINTASMISMFPDSKRIVIVKDYKKNLKTQDQEKLLNYVNEPNDDCTILFVDCASTFNCIADYCVNVDCNKATILELSKYIVSNVEKKNLKINRKACEEIVNRCNFDMGKITQEIDKLVMYCLDKDEITLQDVEDVVCINTEEQIFAVTNAFNSNDKSQALFLIDMMLKRGEKPSTLLAIITSNLRKLFWVINTNSSDEDMCKVLGVKSIYRFKKTAEANKKSRKGYIPYLKKTIDLLTQLEYQFKSGKISEDSALKAAMTHLMD